MARNLAKHASMLGLAAIVLLMASIGLLTFFGFASVQQDRGWVRHTYEVMATADRLGIALGRAGTSQSNYLLTGDDAALASYRDAVGQVARLQGELAAQTADNLDQQERLRALAGVIDSRLRDIDRIVQLRRGSGLQAALAAMHNDPGQVGQVRSGLADLQAAELRLLAERQAQADAAETTTRRLALGGVGLAVVLLIATALLLARSRADLMTSEQRQRTLAGQVRTAFDSVSQGIAAFDTDHGLAHWNQGFASLLGLPGPALQTGTPYAAIAGQAALAAGDGKPFLETPDQIRHGRGGRAPAQPVVFQRTRPADDRSFEIRRTSMPEGGFVLTVADITERVRAEATARDAQRLQAMGQLTGGIAHDFNNLLTVVLGNLQLAQGKLEEGHPVLKHIERAIWGAKRGASLNSQLLAFARRQPLAPAPLNISGVLSDMANLLHRTLGEHIELQVVDAAGLWLAMADVAQLESAVLNLALNARDAMPRGGRLTIEAANKVLDDAYAGQHTEVTPGDYVMVAVSDTGEGMPPEVLARAFEPFFTTKEPGRGTGLGLSMVFGFAKQSGGHVKIYSEAGEGTTVRLYLPRATEAVLPLRARAGAPVDVPGGSAGVLVVEDDGQVRELVVTMLRDLGYRVLEAEDGPSALSIAGESGAGLDLLLADVVLPGGMKCDEMARRLTALRPGLRVLFMSGYTENAIVHQGRLDVGVHLIGKPFSADLLARKVAEVLASPPGLSPRRATAS